MMMRRRKKMRKLIERGKVDPAGRRTAKVVRLHTRKQAEEKRAVARGWDRHAIARFQPGSRALRAQILFDEPQSSVGHQFTGPPLCLRSP